MHTEFDLTELTAMACSAKFAMRMYLHGHPQATPDELDCLVENTVGKGRPEHMVIAAQLVAGVQMTLEELKVQFQPRDLLLTEAILDIIWCDRDNEHPDQRAIARKAWLLWMEYSKRGKSK